MNIVDSSANVSVKRIPIDLAEFRQGSLRGGLFGAAGRKDEAPMRRCKLKVISPNGIISVTTGIHTDIIKRHSVMGRRTEPSMFQ